MDERELSHFGYEYEYYYEECEYYHGCHSDISIALSIVIWPSFVIGGVALGFYFYFRSRRMMRENALVVPTVTVDGPSPPIHTILPAGSIDTFVTASPVPVATVTVTSQRSLPNSIAPISATSTIAHPVHMQYGSADASSSLPVAPVVSSTPVTNAFLNPATSSLPTANAVVTNAPRSFL